ncbi:MAG: 50S ribosomal protein L17 [Muribaculaceae bacterium]|nr:50S ribosomal protein L17 [Muribaculaceae bacterium]
MRHNKKFNHLSRKKAHREALLSNLTISLILHKRIFTTLAKAKALRVYAEPLITRCKQDNMANRRLVFSYLQNKEAVKELFGVVAEKVADRPGGYTRILKTVHRLGDNAEMAMIELVDFNELMLSEKAAKKKKPTRRSRRKKGGETASVETPAAEAPKAEEAPAQEAPAEEAPVAEAPKAEEAPAQEAPAEEAPVEDKAPEA